MLEPIIIRQSMQKRGQYEIVAGSFRIPFHSREQMHTILEKLGCDDITLEPQG